MRLILASRSPRRRELLTILGLPFKIVEPNVDETPFANETPADYARRLSRNKARAAGRFVDAPALVLAADTIVVDGHEILGKPASAAEAADMLQRLSGRTHKVYTAVSLVEISRGRYLTALARSPVPMRAYTEEEIASYIATRDPFDKAGSYAIQHEGFQPAPKFSHCFANVMGLPLCHITRMLRIFNITPPVDVPTACQAAIDYECPVYSRILAGLE